MTAIDVVFVDVAMLVDGEMIYKDSGEDQDRRPVTCAQLGKVI